MFSASTAAVARMPPSSKPGFASMWPERRGIIGIETLFDEDNVTTGFVVMICDVG